ncbi:MAG: hypothetical protein NC336_00895 [Clostridium sp.]|nr:hypothetical protein [Clostridium sp.]
MWKGGKLDRVETSAGYFKDGKLHAYYRDYQGNIRVVACDSAIEQVTHYYPYGLPWAETTNREQSIRKYSGKELYTFFGVNAKDSPKCK